MTTAELHARRSDDAVSYLRVIVPAFEPRDLGDVLLRRLGPPARWGSGGGDGSILVS